jgi:hypothetical protein
MTFFKSLLLAIFATLFLTYVLGVSFLEWFDINVYMNGELIEPLKAIGASALASVILVLIALAIVLSVFGSFIFISLLVVGSLVMMAVGVFWPILLIAIVIWLVTRNKNSNTEEVHHRE